MKIKEIQYLLSLRNRLALLKREKKDLVNILKKYPEQSKRFKEQVNSQLDGIDRAITELNNQLKEVATS